MANEFKTGTDITVRIVLTATPEVVSALAQIVATLYYVRKNKIIKFHWAAKDPSASDVSDEATAESRTVSTITFDGEVIVISIPIVDTDTLVLTDCETVPVFAKIAYTDSSGERQEAVPDKTRRDSDRDLMRDDQIVIPESITICDYYAGPMVKSAGNGGWL
jgi:hypothetical protein